MASKTYNAKLRDPRWQRLRLQALEAADFQCQDCGSETKTLNVHHNHYVYGREPWEYPIRELTVLCDDCHRAVTLKQRALALWLCRLEPSHLDEVLGFVKALACQDGDFEVEHDLGSLEEGTGFVLGSRMAIAPDDVPEVLSSVGWKVSLATLYEKYLFSRQFFLTSGERFPRKTEA